MDCQEKEMFYGAETANGDWISSNYSEYNEFLGIGKPQGFLGLKKFFNTKGYQESMAQSTSNLQGMSSIMSGMNLPTSTAPVSTQSTAWNWNPLNPSAPVTSPLNTNASNLQSGSPLVFAPSSFSTGLNTLASSINNTLGIKQDTASNVLGGGGTKEKETATTSGGGSGMSAEDINALIQRQLAQNTLKDKEDAGNKPDNTLLYVGLAGAGVLLITGFVYMASKGK
jgi:hypothetical protein